MTVKGRVWSALVLAAIVLAQGCSREGTKTPVPLPSPSPLSTQVQPPATRPLPAATAPETTPLPQTGPTARPSELRITWGEWWYEGEYLADATKYPADPQYHDRSFNIRVTIRNDSSSVLPGDVLPVFFLTDGDGERPVITWYYSKEDLRALAPGQNKEAVFRALTYASGQWISRVEIVWRGQVWQKEFPLQ